MERTRGKQKMVRTKTRISMDEVSESVLLRKTKLCPKTQWRYSLTKTTAKIVRLMEINAFAYHSGITEWLKQQSLRVLLAYTHPLDRRGFAYDLEQEGLLN